MKYKSWKKFEGNEIPSSLELNDDIYEFLSKNDLIIDFGCGFGKTCIELFSKGYKNITGVDVNTTGIEFSKNYYTNAEEIKKPVFLIDDVTKLSLPDDSFNFGIMQALLTTIATLEDRVKVFTEARRVLLDKAYLYMAVFCQTWHSPYYRKRYIDGLKLTNEEGSFPVYNFETGKLEYIAHHYSEKELVYLLVNADFEIIRFRYDVFTTRSGQKVNGMVLITQNNK
jgi:ubiquinone/menaquinone biosynthesis C-methylase UbiE